MDKKPIRKEDGSLISERDMDTMAEKDKDEAVNDRMQWKLAEFFLSIGAEEVNGKVKMNWNIVPRATGRVIIEQRADRKDPSKKYNHVKKFLPKAKKEYKAGSF